MAAQVDSASRAERDGSNGNSILNRKPRTLGRLSRLIAHNLRHPFRAAGAAEEPKLGIHVIDVGQGDALFIRCPDGKHEMLIDSGEL